MKEVLRAVKVSLEEKGMSTVEMSTESRSSADTWVTRSGRWFEAWTKFLSERMRMKRLKWTRLAKLSWNIPLRWPLWGSGSSVPTRNNSAPSLLLTVHLLPCRHPFGYVPGLVPFPFFLFYSVHTHLTPLTHHLHSHAHHPLCSPTMCFLYVFNDSQSI